MNILFQIRLSINVDLNKFYLRNYFFLIYLLKNRRSNNGPYGPAQLSTVQLAMAFLKINPTSWSYTQTGLLYIILLTAHVFEGR